MLVGYSMKYMIRYSTIGLWFLFVILTFFAGFRWDVGIDWPAYMDVFGGNIIETASWLERMEPANLGLKILLLLNGLEDGGYYLWLMAFITMFFFFYSIRQYSLSPFLSVVLFVGFGMYFDLMNGVRQYAAISIVVFSWQYLFDKKLIRYILVVFIASLFHMSALIMLPVYFICNMRINKKYLLLFAIISIPLSFVISSLLIGFVSMFAQYETYGDTEFVVANNPLSILRVLFPLSLFAIIIKIYGKLMITRKTRILTNLSLLSIFCTLLFPGVALLIRIGFYFQVAFIFLIPIISRELSFNSGNLFKWFSIIYSFIYISVTQLSRPIANILPFEPNFRLADNRLLGALLLCLLSLVSFVSLLRIGINKHKLIN